MAVNQAAQQKLFNAYISDKVVLIADPNSTSRASIAQILSSIGVKTTQIKLTSSLQEAEEVVKDYQPRIIIADYDLGKRCGLELLQRQREQSKDTRGGVFILVTGNTSQTAVAKAAEEDVDTYLLKPFTSGSLRNAIVQAIMLKIDPPEYLKIIRRGKQEMDEKKFDDALKTFEHSKTLDSAPALGHFYTGQVQDVTQSHDTAEGNYQSGLNHNKIHYKCLVGLYENYMSRKKHTEAYQTIKRISQYFPANPQRMTSVLRLAIVTQSYEDVERYYRLFTSIDERNEEMVKYVCAALVVCGKYYLRQNFTSRALELFQKAAITASGRTKILREIIQALVDCEMAESAMDFLKRFPAETQTGVDFLAMQLLLVDQASPSSLVIEKARALLSKNIHDPIIYKILIRRSNQANLASAVEDLMKTAIEKYPAQKALFEQALKVKAEVPEASK